MSNEIHVLDLIENSENQRRARRSFLRMCGGAAAVAGSMSLLAACDDDDNDNTPTPAPTPTPTGSTGAITDTDVLNFALQLEYLEANYYNYAAYGSGVPTALRSGTGMQGMVSTGDGGANYPRKVAFTDQVVAEYAREIANDEIAHVTFLRTALGNAAAAMPFINLSGAASLTFNGQTIVGAFTAAARAAGVVGASDTFDPFANDENFLLGSMLLTDVGVSAYRGSAKLITNKTFLEAAAGILATECYHDAAIRGTLYTKGVTMPAIYTNTTKISNARDTLDGADDLDQGIVGTDTMSNIVPTNDSGLVLGRTAQQVLNVVFLNKAAVTSGGFFPGGLNGTIVTSGANG